MRKALFAAGVASLLLVAAVAHADVVQTFSISMPPAKAKKPIALNVSEATSDSAGPGTQPPPLRRQILRLNKGGKYNAKYFKRCKKSTLLETIKCPSSSKIGKGSATAVALPIVPLVNASLSLYNGQKQNGHDTIYIYAIPDIGPNLLTIGEVTKKRSGRFDYNIDFKIDAIQTLPGAPDASITSVNTKTPIKKITKKKRKRGRTIKKKYYLIVAPKKCKGGKWVGEAEFHYQRVGEPEIVKTLKGSVKCKKR